MALEDSAVSWHRRVPIYNYSVSLSARNAFPGSQKDFSAEAKECKISYAIWISHTSPWEICFVLGNIQWFEETKILLICGIIRRHVETRELQFMINNHSIAIVSKLFANLCWDIFATFKFIYNSMHTYFRVFKSDFFKRHSSCLQDKILLQYN